MSLPSNLRPFHALLVPITFRFCSPFLAFIESDPFILLASLKSFSSGTARLQVSDMINHTAVLFSSLALFSLAVNAAPSQGNLGGFCFTSNNGNYCNSGHSCTSAVGYGGQCLALPGSACTYASDCFRGANVEGICAQGRCLGPSGSIGCTSDRNCITGLCGPPNQCRCFHA